MGRFGKGGGLFSGAHPPPLRRPRRPPPKPPAPNVAWGTEGGLGGGGLFLLGAGPHPLCGRRCPPPGARYGGGLPPKKKTPPLPKRPIQSQDRLWVRSS